MNKTIKIIATVFIGLLMLVMTLGSALAVEPEIEFKETNWFSNLFGGHGFYIAGGTLSENKVNQGETVDAKVTLRYRLAGDRTKLKLYWFDEQTKDYTFIASKEYAYTSKVGSYISVTANNLPTTNLCPDSNGNYIKLSGTHYVRVDGKWVVDTKSTADLNKGFTDKNEISSNFKMLCDDAECEKENGEPFCSGNRVKQYIVDQEECSLDAKTVDSCKSDETCKNAKCIPDETAKECEDFDYGCSGDNLVAICQTDKSDFSIDKNCADIGLTCEKGECISDEPPIEEQIIWVNINDECLEQSVPETDVPEEYFDTKESCETAKTLPVENPTTGDYESPVVEQTWYQKLFDYKNNTTIAISTTALLALILGLLIYLGYDYYNKK